MKSTIKPALMLAAFFFFCANLMAQDSLLMTSGKRLDKGQKIEVAGKGQLIMQTDGNLVFYNAANQPKWATNTNGKTVTHAIMQTDGHLCLYNNTSYVWGSETAGLGTNNGYLQIDLNTWRVCVHKADKAVAKELSPGNTLRFPRQQNWESQVLYGLCIPASQTAQMTLNGYTTPYSNLTARDKALGTHALAAAEGILVKVPNLTPSQAVNEIMAKPDVRNKILGVMGMLVIDQVIKGGSDASTVELRDWVTQVYRHMKIQATKGSLAEYKKWKENPCTYTGEGYVKPVSCGSTSLVHSMFEVNMPPSDLIGKAGMQYATAEAPAIIGGMSTAMVGLSAYAITSALSAALSQPGVALYFAFGVATGEYASFGLIGATGWAGVAAAPIAVVTFAATMGLSQGLLIYEAKMVEVRLKQAVGAAIEEPINIVNALSDKNGAMLFLFGFMKTANFFWNAPSLATDGEVTFRCDAGFVSKFVLTYNLNGQNVTKTTTNLPLDGEQAFPLPKDATNIVAKGYMVSAGDHLLFTQNIAKPTYTMFKTYNTVFNPSWANAWPLKKPGVVKCVHDGGYVIKYEINCTLDGQPNTTIKEGVTAGMITTFTFPENAKNVRIRAWGATGLAWEPWRLTFDFSYPEPPGMCIKTYGTTLDQKWATDCD